MQFDPQWFGHSGFPEAADSLCYDPLQRLLAVGTQDGRVKVFGREGVEAMFRSPAQCATAHLQFLDELGAILRITQDGDVQLWGVHAGGLLDSLTCADAVTAVAALVPEPYLVLGCRSGGLHVVALLDAAGAPADCAREAASLSLLPYQVAAEEVPGASGPVVALAALVSSAQRRLILVHAASPSVVWDLRCQCVVAVTSAAGREPGHDGHTDLVADADAATAAAWVSERGKCFVSGHVSGAVRVWGMPIAAMGEAATAPAVAEALVTLWVAPNGVQRAPGGGPAQALAWFGAVAGAVLVPAEGALGRRGPPGAVLVLTEGGQLMAHDLGTLQPAPLTLPFQALPPASATCFLAGPALGGEPGGGALTLSELCAARLANEHAGDAAVHALPPRWHWVMGGGRPPNATDAPAAGLAWLSGHRDGRVRAWDLATNVPRLLATVPFDSGGAGGKLRAVCAMMVCPVAGLLVVAHDKGDVRVYQHSTAPCEVACCHLGPGSGAADRSSAWQPAGFQCVLLLALHSASVCALALASAAGLLALGDEAGRLTLIDLRQAAVHFARQLADQPIAALAFAAAAAPPRGLAERLAERRREGEGAGEREARLALYVAAADCSLAVIDARSGEPLGRDAWLRPRATDSALALLPLDAASELLPPPAAPLPLAWARSSLDDGGAGARSEAVSSGEEEDDDELLSAAVAAAEAQAPKRERKGFGLLKGRARRGGEPAGEAPAAIPSAGLARWARRGSELQQRGHPSSPPVPAGPAADGGLPLEAAGAEAPAGSPAAMSRVSELGSSGALLGSPMSSSELPAAGRGAVPAPSGPTVAYVVLVSRSHLRVYPAEGVRTADRATLKKVFLEDLLDFAGPFHAPEGPALACLSASGRISVWALPGLEALLERPLGAVLGFPLPLPADPHRLGLLPRLCSLSPDGQLALVGRSGEVVRVGLQAQLRSAGEIGKASGLSGFLTQVQKAATRVVDDTSKELRNLNQALPPIAEAARSSGSQHGSERSAGADSGADDDAQPGRLLGPRLMAPSRSQEPFMRGARAASEVDLQALERPRGGRAGARTLCPADAARAELFRGARAPAPAAPGVRTADEIKAAYGRPAGRRSEALTAGLEETRSRLEERGERLRGLQNRSEQLQNDALSFEAMTKQLREREAGRKWWQL
ncbi:hypothetical protein WJX81_004841 [Elliptochloris bilobata]|uniref:V-SNARE coiled-coil homology domain-containing protein n=1 Tax=Elliptochloris bilobata TaxID=381761 RepID=A0AAW1QA09_9CHLO